MIQFFVSTKPDRERALYYYQRMLKANVKPSAHTYKLLLDCYGSLHPVDVRSMRDVFKTLEKDIPVEGTHWAALINSYGLSQNDLDTAIETFESIKQHPQSRKSGLPDAVTFEAMLNTCLANGRPDLVEHFSAEMRSSGLHSTAYCENARIKVCSIPPIRMFVRADDLMQAFTRQGNLEGSRAVFDALADPPSGVAATGNHPGGRRHGKKRLADRPASGSPVYREPSSYDAMIRAEVQMGDPARASEIVDLARQRAFPAQVIKGLQDLLNTPVQ